MEMIAVWNRLRLASLIFGWKGAFSLDDITAAYMASLAPGLSATIGSLQPIAGFLEDLCQYNILRKVGDVPIQYRLTGIGANRY
jgi:hypothetical protein